MVVLITAQMAGAGSSEARGSREGMGAQGGEGAREARGPREARGLKGGEGRQRGEGRQGRRGAGLQGEARGPGRAMCMRKEAVHAEGLGKCQRCQARAVVRTYLKAFHVLLVLGRKAREAQNIQWRVRLGLHGRHDAQGSLGGEARREVRLL